MEYVIIPDFCGELYSSLDDEGFLWMCGHAGLLLHHKRAEDENTTHMICLLTANSLTLFKVLK